MDCQFSLKGNINKKAFCKKLVGQGFSPAFRSNPKGLPYKEKGGK